MGGAISRMTNQVFGLGLMTATAVVMLVVTVVLLDPSDAGTAAVLALVLGATAYLVSRSGALWAVIVGLVVSLAAAMTIFYIAFGILQPFSPIEFTAGLLLVVGFLFALVGGLGAIIRRRTAQATGARLRLGALGLIGIGMLVSIGGFLVSRSTVDPVAASGAVVIEMSDFQFDPEAVSISVGDRLVLTNADAFAHDFTVEDFDLYMYLGPGSEALVDVSELPPGTYDYFCSLHTFEGEGMVGTVTVEA